MRRTIDVNCNAMNWSDYLKVRNTKPGTVIILSDGNEYEVVNNTTRFSDSGHKEMSYIPYGVNNTVDNR